MPVTTTPVQLRFPPAVKQALESYADMRDLTMTSAVRQLVAAGLKKEADDLGERAAANQRGRESLMKMIRESRNDEDLQWLYDKLKEYPDLPNAEDVPQWIENGYESELTLLEEAHKIMDLALQVRRST